MLMYLDGFFSLHALIWVLMDTLEENIYISCLYTAPGLLKNSVGGKERLVEIIDDAYR